MRNTREAFTLVGPAILLIVVLFAAGARAQMTGFSYQGSLKNAGAPANGNHDFEFRLWDAASGGAQIGTTVSLNNVAVTNGIFAVTLDFGDQFPGTSRFLEVRVRPTGGGAFTALTPREKIKAVPYAVKSLNTEQLGGVAASQYVTTTNGGANFIQNTTTQQASSNFNISGNGVVGGNLGIGTSAPNYKLHIVGQDLRVEANSPSVNPRFSLNFIAGPPDQKKWQNYATADSLRFSMLNDAENSETVWLNVIRSGIAPSRIQFSRTPEFFIDGVILSEPRFAVLPNGNVGIGVNAPTNKLHVNGGSEILSTGFGAGFKFRDRASTSSANDWVWYSSGNRARLSYGASGDFLNVDSNGNVGIGVTSPDKLAVNGTMSIATLGEAGATTLCRNSVNQISTCSSSLRYKTNIGRFSQGMSFISELRPISFDWKDGGLKDVGFGAEDIAKIDPRFVTYNSAGEVEGVKYDRLSVAFVNAFKEQQAEISELRASSSEQAKKIEDQNSKIEDQKAQIERQRRELDALKNLVCAQNPTADVCKEQK